MALRNRSKKRIIERARLAANNDYEHAAAAAAAAEARHSRRPVLRHPERIKTVRDYKLNRFLARI